MRRDGGKIDAVRSPASSDGLAAATIAAVAGSAEPRRYREPTNLDVLALHEAFADIVAIFQRFSYAEVVAHQIAKTRGNLETYNLLAQLAQQVGRAIGKRGALRDALGGIDKKTGQWKPKEANATLIQRTQDTHDRGAILVAAVFDAFVAIYQSRIADLLRIATGGTGVLPDGEIQPDLVGRLASEASDTAEHVLRMCIRAMDYCPPVDVTFGDYLRVLITADHDLYVDDPRHYRVAFIESFRRWGIYPKGMKALSEETLLWPQLRELLPRKGTLPLEACELRAPERVRPLEASMEPVADAPPTFGLLAPGVPRVMHTEIAISDGSLRRGVKPLVISMDWDLRTNRQDVWKVMKNIARVFHIWLTKGGGQQYAALFGLVLEPSRGHPTSAWLLRPRETEGCGRVTDTFQGRRDS